MATANSTVPYPRLPRKLLFAIVFPMTGNHC